MTTPKHARRAMIRPDRPGMAVTAVALASIVAVAAFFISFEALTQIGRTLELPLPWLVPIALDGAILAATALLLVEASRGHRGALPWAIVYGSTLASSAANGWSHWERGQGLAPSATAALAPWLLLVLTHAIAHILVDGEPVADDAAETVGEREQAEAEHVVAAVPEHAEQAVVASAARAGQPMPEAAEQHVRQAVEQVAGRAPEVVEQAAQVEAEQAPVRVEQAVRPVTAKASSTSARKPSSASPAADAEAREQAVSAVLSGTHSQSAASKQFGVSRGTLQRELEKAKQAA